CRNAIGLPRVEQEPAETRRGAEADRQHPGGERIETASVPRLRGCVESSYLLERTVRGEPTRLVEQQDPADVPAACRRGRHRRSGSVARAVRGAGFVDQPAELDAAASARVMAEAQLGHASQAEGLTDARAKEPAGLLEALANVRRIVVERDRAEE